ncbi:MAG: hypothetical protein DRQ99_18915 [Candidatus Parabeggiatoa sp. nov. 3]|nr:MAG: hypothetical protein DRQ99_18915 [Gammaproteobacteria bacterium]
MSIELELHLEGEDANEEMLSDLIYWLECANIEGLTVARKELPHTKGDMGGLFDPEILRAIVSNVVTLAGIAITVASWQKNKEVVIDPMLKNADEVLQENEAKIQALLAEIKGKANKNK